MPISRRQDTTQEASGHSVNAAANRLLKRLKAEASRLRFTNRRLANGCTVIDAGIDTPGGLSGGLRIAEICMGGLGEVSLECDHSTPTWPWRLNVRSCDPVIACLASQYAGWSLSLGEGREAYHAMGSGPARALARKEVLFSELGYVDQSQAGCLVLEVDRFPPPELAAKIAADCGIDSDALTLILTPTRSLAGVVQVVARVLEVALHKAHSLGFPLTQIVDGLGSAPLPPPAPDFITAMGRTNDAILYGGQVQLFVSGSDAEAADLARALPSSGSRDYGKPFSDIFTDYHCDFFQIDPLLFSPAAVTVSCLDSGRSFHAGALNSALLEQAFGATR